MSDVFVSYARPDEPHAERIAEALRGEGYSVWRDDELPAHRAYADVIEERLKSADAVVVLWSADAARSQWVRAEADAARSAGTLVQATVDGCDVAKKLGVSHVLEGSVRKAGGRVRINAQLIDGATGDHVWAERYDRDLDDIFAIQDEISKAIVGALRLKLLPEEKKAIE